MKEAIAISRDSIVLNKTESLLNVERLCIILLALCPILQHYKGLFVNAAVTVLLIVFPYAVFSLLKKQLIGLRRLKFVAPLIVFFAYKVLDHGTNVSELGQALIFSVLVVAIAAECFNTKYFIRVITIISVFASICIIVQYFFYYLLHTHVQMVPTRFLLDRSSQWILAAQTGRASVTGRVSRFYRPSAFFLEPSHMYIYMFTPLLLSLLSGDSSKREKITAMVISVGMILSTSGMGIAMAVGIWGVYFGINKNKKESFSLLNYFRPSTMVLLLGGVIGVAILYLEVPFFRYSIERIIGSGSDYTNAIAGRVSDGNDLIRTMKGMQLLIGVEDTLTGIEFNMSGFNSTMYRYGIIGVILSYLFYFRGFFLRGKYFWLTLVVITLSFFSAHTHSTMLMIYLTFVFVDGYHERMRC